jgi:hypothetical protein
MIMKKPLTIMAIFFSVLAFNFHFAKADWNGDEDREVANDIELAVALGYYEAGAYSPLYMSGSGGSTGTAPDVTSIVPSKEYSFDYLSENWNSMSLIDNLEELVGTYIADSYFRDGSIVGVDFQIHAIRHGGEVFYVGDFDYGIGGAISPGNGEVLMFNPINVFSFRWFDTSEGRLLVAQRYRLEPKEHRTGVVYYVFRKISDSNR